MSLIEDGKIAPKKYDIVTVRFTLLVEGLYGLVAAANKDANEHYIGSTKSIDFIQKDFEKQLHKHISKANGTLHYKSGAHELFEALDKVAREVLIISQLSPCAVERIACKLGPLTYSDHDPVFGNDKGIICPEKHRDVLELYKKVSNWMETPDTSPSSLSIDFDYLSIPFAREVGLTPIIFTGFSSNPKTFAQAVSEAGACYASPCLKDIARKVAADSLSLRPN